MNSVRKFVKKVLKRVAYHLTKEKKHRLTVKKKEGGGLPPPKKRKKTKSLERLAAMVWLAGCYGSAGFGSPFRPPPPFPQHLYKAPQGPLFETTRSLSCHGSRPMTYWFASGTMLGTTTRLQSCNLDSDEFSLRLSNLWVNRFFEMTWRMVALLVIMDFWGFSVVWSWIPRFKRKRRIRFVFCCRVVGLARHRQHARFRKKGFRWSPNGGNKRNQKKQDLQ